MVTASAIASSHDAMSTHDPFEGTKYRLVELLGTGAAAEVFLVEHKGLGSRYVAKVLHPWLVQGRAGRRFNKEARALAQLQHQRNIVSVFGFDTVSDGRPFIVLEHLEGETLAQAMAIPGRLSLAFALVVTWEILSALAAAHRHEIVHRDIRPDNVLIARRADGTTLVKVLDFGIARLLRDAHEGTQGQRSDPTTIGTVLGSARFSSPETAMGQPADKGADLYSAALVLYFMLTGRGAFEHLSDTALSFGAHAIEDPEPPSHCSNLSIPAELDEVVLRALSRNAEKRFQTAEDFLQALGPITQDVLGADRGSAELVGWNSDAGDGLSQSRTEESRSKSGTEARAPLRVVPNEPARLPPQPDASVRTSQPEPEPERKLQPGFAIGVVKENPRAASVASWRFRMLVLATFILAAVAPAIAVFTFVMRVAGLL
jgi:serine/threonine-protein kinase